MPCGDKFVRTVVTSLLLALMSSPAMPKDPAQNEPDQLAAPNQPLKLLAKLKLKVLPQTLAWFPDSRRLAIFSGGVRVVDTMAQSVSPPLIDGSGLGGNLVVSPDGLVMAVIGSHLRLYSTETWRELARVNTKEVANCWHGGLQGMAFTPDSRFIWVGCGSLGIIGAIKLTVPDLTFADTVEIARRVSPGTRSESHDIYVRSAPLTLHVVTYVHAGSGLAQQFGRVIDLTSKTDLLPSMPFPRDEAPLHGPSSNYLASDRVSLLVYRGILETGTIVTYDISTRGRVTLFAPLSEIGTSNPVMQPERAHWGLSNLIPIPNNRVLAALASQNLDGGLMIWDYRTGQRIQRIYGPGMSYIALSPDGTRVAGSFLEEIYVYSLKTDHKP